MLEKMTFADFRVVVVGGVSRTMGNRDSFLLLLLAGFCLLLLYKMELFCDSRSRAHTHSLAGLLQKNRKVTPDWKGKKLAADTRRNYTRIFTENYFFLLF